MKCVSYTGGLGNKALGQVDRLKDDVAHKLVSQGKATYIPKKVYRDAIVNSSSG